MWRVFSFEVKLVVEKSPRAREGCLQNNRENTRNLPKNVILRNPFKRKHRPDLFLGLFRVTYIADVPSTRGTQCRFSAVVYYIQVIWRFYWKTIFSLFGAGFWSLAGTSLCFVSVPDFLPCEAHSAQRPPVGDPTPGTSLITYTVMRNIPTTIGPGVKQRPSFLRWAQIVGAGRETQVNAVGYKVAE